jgi:hypothetical protein
MCRVEIIAFWGRVARGGHTILCLYGVKVTMTDTRRDVDYFYGVLLRLFFSEILLSVRDWRRDGHMSLVSGVSICISSHLQMPRM